MTANEQGLPQAVQGHLSRFEISMIELASAVLGLISLHGPGDQLIDINPHFIVSTRKPHAHNEGYFDRPLSV
jgi:hypothetical protein